MIFTVLAIGRLRFSLDLVQGQLLLAVSGLDFAGGFDLFAVGADFFVEAFGDIVLGHPVGDRFAVFFGLNYRLALVGLMEAALGAFGFTLDGDFFAFRSRRRG